MQNVVSPPPFDRPFLTGSIAIGFTSHHKSAVM